MHGRNIMNLFDEHVRDAAKGTRGRYIMRKQRRVFAVHQIQAGMIEPDAPYIEEEPGTFPYNCRTPCCYGRGRSFCWPCMRQILDAHSASRR